MKIISNRGTKAWAVILLFVIGFEASAQQAQYYIKPELYRVSESEYCRIVNQAQYQVMQGNAQPDPLPDYFDLFAGKKDNGNCDWPEGLYRSSDLFGVIRVGKDSRCMINNEVLLNAYGGRQQVVNLDGSNPFKSLKNKGACGWPTGLYKYADKSEVYKVAEDNYCQVTSQSQLEQYLKAFNVAGINSVTKNIRFTNNKTDAGDCPVSNGFYQRGNQPEIYYLTDSQACHVATPTQLNMLGGGNIVQLSANVNIYQGRKNAGDCGWPAGFYRKQNERQIYRIAKNRELCLVATMNQFKKFGGQPGLVMSIPANTNLKAGAFNKGVCK